MASNDIPSESHDLCKTEIPIITFNNLKSIDPSLPYPITGYVDYVRDNYSHSLFSPSSPIGEPSICTCMSLEEKTRVSMDKDGYVPLAKKALTYYNAKENSNLSFVKVKVATYECGPKTKVHMNFIATSEDGMEKLLFSELTEHNVLKCKSESLDEIHVNGCCLLQKIESGNPIGWGCAICGDEIIHPGPRHGYLIVGGDSFEGYPFWDYRRSPWISNPTPDDQKMYSACALKALDYFNSKQSTDFLDVEVGVGSYNHQCLHKKIVHVNFKCITSHKPKQELFFAELVIPTFTPIEDGRWDIRKEPYIVVKGCCLLEKVDFGKPFGRVCEACYCNEVIHPGPKDGYRVVVGDDFTGHGFMNIGGGIF